nr:syntaxin-32 [Ipomoea batatas]
MATRSPSTSLEIATSCHLQYTGDGDQVAISSRRTEMATNHLRIDENMDDTLANVEGAQGALLKYLNSISSNRWLMIKIFFVLIFFLMIFLFFVA